MKNETILRFGFVVSILLLLWVTVMWNNDIIVIDNQKNTIDSLKGEIEVQQSITDYYDRLWIRLSELHPKDAEKVKHETE